MNTLHTGPCWRIAPSGTTSVYLVRYSADGSTATVHSRGQVSRWAKQPMQVAAADLFASQEEARAEYRRRRALVETSPGRKAFNLTSGLALLASLAVFATPAVAQPALFPPQNMTSQQLGDFTYHSGGGWNGTTQQLGSFGYTDLHGPNGQNVQCTSQKLGSFTYTDCH